MTATAPCGATVRRRCVTPPRHRRPRPQHGQEQPAMARPEALPASRSRCCRSRPRAPTMTRRRRCVRAAPAAPPNAGTRWRAACSMHRLLQSLPDIPRAARTEAALRHLARAAGDFSAEEQREPARTGPARARRCAVLRTVLARKPRRGARSSAASRAAPFAVSGQVDRLAVTADAVLIADYKTNRPAPERFEDVPPAYVRQLALYRAVLAQLYPDKAIRAALLWTDVPDLMEIPASAMDRELAAVTSA